MSERTHRGLKFVGPMYCVKTVLLFQASSYSAISPLTERARTPLQATINKLSRFEFMAEAFHLKQSTSK